MDIRVAVTSHQEFDIISKAIETFLHTNYSHTIIIFKNKDGVDTVFQANKHGVNDLPLTEFIASKRSIVKECTIPLSVHPEFFLGYVEGSRGKDYSPQTYIGFMVPALQELFGDGAKNFVCSELTATVINYQTDYAVGARDDYTSPKNIGDFIDIINKHGVA